MKKDYVDALSLISEDCITVFRNKVHQAASPFYYSNSDEMASCRAIQASKLTSACIEIAQRTLNERFSAVAKDWPEVSNAYQNKKTEIHEIIENAFEHLKEVRRKNNYQEVLTKEDRSDHFWGLMFLDEFEFYIQKIKNEALDACAIRCMTQAMCKVFGLLAPNCEPLKLT